MNIHTYLTFLTAHVRETKGPGEALDFYVKHIQPIQDYFGGSEETKKIKLKLNEEQETVVREVNKEKAKGYTNTPSESDNMVLGIVLCDTCKNSEHGIKCLVKHKFKEDNKTQSEFIKILGGAIQKCDYYDKNLEVN